MKDNRLKVEVAQRELSDLGGGKSTGMPNTKAKNLVLSHPFFHRSRAGRPRRNL